MSQTMCLEEWMCRLQPQWKSDFLSKDFRYAKISPDSIFRPTKIGFKPHYDCGFWRRRRQVFVPLQNLIQPGDKIRFLTSIKYDVLDVTSPRTSLKTRIMAGILRRKDNTLLAKDNLLNGMVAADDVSPKMFPLEQWLTVLELPNAMSLMRGQPIMYLKEQNHDRVWKVDVTLLTSVREIELMKEEEK